MKNRSLTTKGGKEVLEVAITTRCSQRHGGSAKGRRVTKSSVSLTSARLRCTDSNSTSSIERSAKQFRFSPWLISAVSQTIGPRGSKQALRVTLKQSHRRANLSRALLRNRSPSADQLRCFGENVAPTDPPESTPARPRLPSPAPAPSGRPCRACLRECGGSRSSAGDRGRSRNRERRPR